MENQSEYPAPLLYQRAQELAQGQGQKSEQNWSQTLVSIETTLFSEPIHIIYGKSWDFVDKKHFICKKKNI